MAKPEWGVKRICPACGLKYYDFNNSPITCPSCNVEFDPDIYLKSRKGKSFSPKVVAENNGEISNLDDIEVKFADEHTDKIMITDDVGIKLKYPTINSVGNLEGQDVDSILNYVVDSIDYIYDQEKIYEDTNKKELKEFIENMSKKQFQKIMTFFNTLPKLAKTITFTCAECGEEETITVEGLQGFFA